VRSPWIEVGAAEPVVADRCTLDPVREDGAGGQIEFLETGERVDEGDMDVGVVLVEGDGVWWGCVEDEDAGHGVSWCEVRVLPAYRGLPDDGAVMEGTAGA